VRELPRAALRRVRSYAAIIGWMQSIVSPAPRIRSARTIKENKRPQVADEAAKNALWLPEGTGSNQREDLACPRALDGAEMGLADTASESDTSNPQGMPQLCIEIPSTGHEFSEGAASSAGVRQATGGE
jgi:hypothetical protein